MSVEPHESPPRLLFFARRRRKKHRCVLCTVRHAEQTGSDGDRVVLSTRARSLRHSPRQRHTCSPAKLFFSLLPLQCKPKKRGGEASRREVRRKLFRPRAKRDLRGGAFYTATYFYSNNRVDRTHPCIARRRGDGTRRNARVGGNRSVFASIRTRNARVAPITRRVNRLRWVASPIENFVPSMLNGNDIIDSI